MRVLLVEDSQILRDSISTGLRQAGYAVDTAGDGNAGLWYAESNDYDVIVLDLMLPGIDGLTILRKLRAEGHIPVILLTARADEVDRVVGLELGADDYVVKPFSPRELAARVRNVLRRTTTPPAPAASAAIEVDGLRIDPVTREVHVDGRLVALTPKEFDLLLTLARSPRRVFTRRQLLADVWDSAPEYQDPATVTVHVGRLRQKLEADPEDPRWITTARGVGYRFEP
jgi:DNA-binding response OmpR family regulator